MLVIALVVLGLLIAMMYFYKGKKMPPTDYYTLFVMGVCWVPIGIVGFVIGNPGMNFFFIMGLVFMGVGLKHKDEWKKNHRAFSQLSKEEQKFKMILFIVLGVLLFLGLAAFYIVRLV